MLLGGLIGINDTWLRDGGLFKGDLNTIKKVLFYESKKDQPIRL